MTTTNDQQLERLQTTARTARCDNAFFRQKQLKSLHDTLRTASLEILDSIERDTGASKDEARFEAATTLRIIKDHYASIDPTKELDSEYRIANSKDASDRTLPYGVVYIELDVKHTPLFNTISPLAAALAAGNCIALKFENTSRVLPSLLRNLLQQALEPDTLAILTTAPSSEVLSECLTVLQSGSDRTRSPLRIISSSERVIAVVDRTADLSRAAEALVAARFSFGGRSPYAPDLVLVHEFAKGKFTEHVLTHAMTYLASSSPPQSGAPAGTAKSGIDGILTTLQSDKSRDVRTIARGDADAIVELISRNSNFVLPPDKLDVPILAISAVSSLDHAIDLLVNSSTKPYAAAYHFAAPAHAKYLAQFITADVTFANHIPMAILLGPVAPSLRSIDIEKRYSKEDFVRNFPIYITHDTKAVASSRWKSGVAPAALLEHASSEVRERKRAEWIAYGFFEHGIFIGLGTIGIPLITCLGAGVFYGVSRALRSWPLF